MHSPKQDGQSPKIKTPRLNELLEQREVYESLHVSPRQAWLAWARIVGFGTDSLLQRLKTRIKTYQFIQHQFIKLMSTFGLENMPQPLHLAYFIIFTEHNPNIYIHLGPIPMQQYPKPTTPNFPHFQHVIHHIKTNTRNKYDQKHTNSVQLP